jgi:hypothetical protein
MKFRYLGQLWSENGYDGLSAKGEKAPLLYHNGEMASSPLRLMCFVRPESCKKGKSLRKDESYHECGRRETVIALN